MLELSHGCKLVETASDLPELPGIIGTLYADAETSSGDPTIKSLNPWDVEHCRVIGVGVTWDNCPTKWFIPRALCKRFFEVAFAYSLSWCNHNIKYDAHVLKNDLGLEFDGEYIDTVAKAKVYDSDRMYRGGYTLAALSKTLCGLDIDEYDKALAPYLHKTKDYGAIPLDILAQYGCMDIEANRRLNEFLDANMHEESAWVAQNEVRLTAALLAMERRGMYAVIRDVKIELLRSMHAMIQINAKLENLAGAPINANSPNDCYDLLINQLGYPPIIPEDSETGNASFSADVLDQYGQLDLGERAFSALQLVRDYRDNAHNASLFWEPWIELADANGVLHPSYNQNVRSGRMSCSMPNAQQLHILAKAMIRARRGRKLLCWDYSQLEYRWMVHYLNNDSAINAYNSDPKTDYHQWVATDLCGGIKRRAAKTLNFTIGFGGGKKRVIHMLSLDPDIIRLSEGNRALAVRMATDIYFGYHRNLPELKEHSRKAENAALMNGFVRTVYGRRLHLPNFAARKGFNRAVQGTAADCAKEGLVEASPVFNKVLRDHDAHLIAQVHDEYLYDVPDDEDAIRVIRAEVTRCLELPSARCRVPILADAGPTADTWKEAKA